MTLHFQTGKENTLLSSLIGYPTNYESMCIDSKIVVFIRARLGKKETDLGLHVNNFVHSSRRGKL